MIIFTERYWSTTSGNTKTTAATKYFHSSCLKISISSQRCFIILCSGGGEVKTHFMVVQSAFTWDTGTSELWSWSCIKGSSKLGTKAYSRGRLRFSLLQVEKLVMVRQLSPPFHTQPSPLCLNFIRNTSWLSPSIFFSLLTTQKLNRVFLLCFCDLHSCFYKYPPNIFTTLSSEHLILLYVNTF